MAGWYPSGDQNNALTYEGSVTVPSFCDPGARVRLQQGGTFHTNVSSTDTQDKVNLRWHYKDGTGGGWSGTYSVIPSVATVCTVTNTRTNLIYSTLQGAQDAASNGDTLTVQNTCTGTTTISQNNLTIEGVNGTSPTLDGNQAGTVLYFEPNLTFTVDNLTIQHGHAINGGGVAIHDGSTFTFSNVTVINNTADRSGGGFYIDPASTGTLDSAIVQYNASDVGSGVSIVDSGVTITDSTVTLNLPVRPDSTDYQVAAYANPVLEYYNITGALRVHRTTVTTVGTVGVDLYATASSVDVWTVVASTSWVKCVTNQQTGLSYPTLQAAHDFAEPGDNLQVNGTCHGQTIFTHDVNVTGPGVLDGRG